MADVAQLVRALDCGSGGRGFKSHHSPQITNFYRDLQWSLFCYTAYMKIKTLTWNIGGGKLLQPGADSQLLASYTVDGLQEIIALLRAENPDIITLQEVQKSDHTDQAKTIAEALGYSYVHDSTSASHIDDGHQLGHAIFTRHSLGAHKTGLFDNPKYEVEWEDGSQAVSFDKGYSTCVITIDGRPVAVTTLHLIPFRRFKVDVRSKEAKAVLRNVEETLGDNPAPWLIQGDFNINASTMQDFFPRLFAGDTEEITLDSGTTPKGHMYDHIIAKGGKITDYTVIDDVLTDHYPVVAEIEV